MPPLFDFSCSKCNKTREYLAQHDEIVLCLSCGERMEKQLSTPNFQFIGSGFYQNDYKTRKIKGTKNDS